MKQAMTKKPLKASVVKKKKSRQKAQNKKGQKLRVLILEDNPADAELMERQLRREKTAFAFRRVETRAGFLKSLKEFKPDLILADYTLPGFDALKALKLAREKHPFLPFIVVTGTIGEERAVACLRAGADDYLLKDRLTRLGEAVRHALDVRRLQTEKSVSEASLQAAAESWRTTFDSMNDAVCLLDEKGAVQRCNRAMNRLLQIPFNRIIGRDCLALICGKEKRRSCAFTQMMKTRQRMEEETFWRGRWYHVTVDPVIGSPGKLIGAVHIMTDITQQKKSEDALRKSEERFRGLYENSTIGLYRTTPNGRIILANHALIRMLGYGSFADLAERNLEKNGFEPTYPRRRFCEQLEKKGQVIGLESAWIKKDGTTIHIRESANTVRDENGDILFYDGTVEDISERIQAERSLHEMNEIFRLFLKHNPIYVFIKDENIRPIYLSENYEKLLGRPLQEILGKSMAELFPSPLSHSMVENDKGILRDGMARESIEELGGRTYSTLKFPIIIDGKAKYLAGYTTDITERKQAQESLQATSRRLELALQSANAGTWDWNVVTSQIEWSPQMFDLFGLDPQTNSASFESWRRALHPEDREIAEKRIDQALKQHATLDNDYRIVMPNGQIRWINAIGVGVYDDSSRPSQMIGICQDISERKKTEEQIRSSLHEKEILLKEIHHRVKNNLQVISGLLTLQAAQIEDERLQHIIKDSQSRIWTMALIHQTLYQSGNLANIEIADFIRGLTGNLLSSQARVAMPPTVNFDLLPLRLAIDKAIPLALVINELLTNSLKHAFPDGRSGEIRITLKECRDRSRPVPPDPGRISSDDMDTTPKGGTADHAVEYELTVSDNGIGLPEGFDVANQKSLGLQLVTMLARQLNGALAMQSAGGTTVRITFKNENK